MYSLLASAINHPDAVNPYNGLFNQRSLTALSESGVSIDAVSPRPFAPPVGPYSAYWSLPATVDLGAYVLHRPRIWYLLPKRWFYSLTGESYARRVPAYAERTFDPPDVVHACHIYPDGYGMLEYSRRHDVPLFVVAHGTLLNGLDDQSPGVPGKIRETLEGASAVLCVSDDLAAKARTLTDPDRVETVPIGADPDRFPLERSAQLRRELDVPDDVPVVLFVGSFTEAKGIAELIEVLPTLDPSDARYVFVGSGGPLESELRDVVQANPTLDAVVYAGLSPEALRRWFVVADLLLLPSRSEGRPTVIYEAMASKTAVLATDVGGIPEQVVDGETGVLVPPRDVERLGQALNELVADRDRLKQLGESGYDRLRDEGWTWDDHARRVQQLHREAIE